MTLPYRTPRTHGLASLTRSYSTTTAKMMDRHVTWAPLPTVCKPSETAFDTTRKPVRSITTHLKISIDVKRISHPSTNAHQTRSRSDSLPISHEASNEDSAQPTGTTVAIKRHGAIRWKLVPVSEMQNPPVFLPGNGNLRRRGAVRRRTAPVTSARKSSLRPRAKSTNVSPTKLCPERSDCLVNDRETR